VFGCIGTGEFPSWRSLCNAFCGNGVGTVAGLGSCSASNNCPAAGCCDTAAQQGQITSCLTGNGATLTFNCTTPGIIPVFTPVPLTVACPLATASVGTFYNSSVVASGGSGIYTSYVLSSISPSGFWGSISPVSSKYMTGMPVPGGPFTFSVTVTDSVGATKSVPCSMTVTPAPVLNCVAISPVLEQTVPFVAARIAQASSGFGAYTYSSTSVSPANAQLTVNSAGLLNSFTPSSYGLFYVNVKVTDGAQGVATASCPVQIIPPPTPICPETAPGTFLTQGFEGVPLPPASSRFVNGTGPSTQFSFTTTPAFTYAYSGATFQGTQVSTGSTSPKVYTYTIQILDARNGRVSKQKQKRNKKRLFFCSIRELPFAALLFIPVLLLLVLLVELLTSKLVLPILALLRLAVVLERTPCCSTTLRLMFTPLFL
jgi:hypothetical protein